MPLSAITIQRGSDVSFIVYTDYSDNPLVNSIGNLGGFVAPTAFGFLEQTTGSIEGGLYGLAITSLVAAVVIFFARTAPRRDKPDSLSGRPEAATHADSSEKSQALNPGPSGAAV